MRRSHSKRGRGRGRGKGKGRYWLREARESMERRGTVGSYGRATAAKTARDKRSRDPKLRNKAQFAENMRKLAAKRKKKGRHASRS